MYDVLRLPDQTDYDYSIALGRQALAIANQARANQGKSPVLYWYPLIHDECYKHTQYMAAQKQVSHDNVEDRYAVFQQNGGSGSGENCVRGMIGPSTVFNRMCEWFDSSGHLANILNAKGNASATAFFPVSGYVYGCQMFANFGDKTTEDPYSDHRKYGWAPGLIVPQITGIQILPNDGGKTATITAVGRGFITGAFEAICTNPSGTEYKFTLTFSNTTQGSNTNVPIGTGFVQSGVKYTMKSVMTATRVVFCQNVTFQLPTGNPTVTSFTATNPTTDLEYTQLRFLGTNLLIAGTYTVVLSGTITLEFDGSTIAGSSTALVKASGADAILAFATIYQVTSITHSSGKTITHSSPNVVVPPAHPNVQTNYPRRYAADPTYFLFDAIGAGFTGSIVTIKLGNLNISCTIQSSTLAKSGPVKVDGTNIKYNAYHYIKGAWMDGVPIYYESSGYLSPQEVPVTPTVKDITYELNSDPNFVDVTLVGWYLPTSGTFTALFNNTIEVTFAAKTNLTTQTKKVPISTSGSSFIYGKSYRLSSVSHTSASITGSNIYIDLPSAPAVPTVSSVSSTLTSDKKGMVLTVKGTNLPTTGTFTVKYSSGTTQTATMSGSSSTSSGNSVTIGIFPSGVVSYGTKYTISSIEHSESSLSGTTGKSFTVPTGPARVTGVTVTNLTDNAKVSLKLTGADLLTSGTYSFKFSSLTTTFSVVGSSTSETKTVELTVGSGMQLAAGATYTLSTVTHSGGQTVLVGPSISFTTGTPIVRTVSAVSSTLTSDKKGMVLTVKGTNLPTTGTFTVKYSSGTTQTATMSGSSSTTSGNSAAIAIFPSGAVSYGTKYTISSIEHTSYSLSGTTGQSFTVPTGPARISSMTQSFTSDNRKVSVRLVGTALPTSGQITFTLSPISKSYTVACSSPTQTNTVDITIGSDKDLAASKTYTLSSVSHSAGTTIIHSSPTFTTGTPKVPTVSSVAASLAGDKKGVILTIKGSNLPTSDSFTLKYTYGSVRTFTLNPSSTTTSASVTVPIYPTGSAEYGKTYTASITHPSFTLDGASQSFSVPAGPPRMTDASAAFSADKSSVTITFVGSALPTSGDYTFTMNTKSGSKQFTAKPTSSSQAKSDAITVGESGVLALGTKYSILSLTHSTATLCEGVSVTIPTLDPTVQNVKADLDTDLDFVVVILEGTTLPTTGTYTVKLSNSKSFTASPVSEREARGKVQMRPIDVLNYASTYPVSSITHSTAKITAGSLSLKTPTAPERVIGVTASFSSDGKKLVIKVTGTSLPVLSITLTFVASSQTASITSNSDISVKLDVSTNTGGETSLAIDDAFPFAYDTNYQLKSVKETASGREIASVPVTVSIPTKPAPPVDPSQPEGPKEPDPDTPGPDTPGPEDPTNPEDPKKPKAMMGAMIGGIAGGVAVVVIVVVVIIVLVVVRNRRKNQRSKPYSTQLEEIGVPEDSKVAIRDGWDYNPSTYNKNTVIAPSQPPALPHSNQHSHQPQASHRLFHRIVLLLRNSHRQLGNRLSDLPPPPPADLPPPPPEEKPAPSFASKPPTFNSQPPAFQQKKIEPKPYQPSTITAPKPAFELKKTQPKPVQAAPSLPPPPADLPPPPPADLLPPPPEEKPAPAFAAKTPTPVQNKPWMKSTTPVAEKKADTPQPSTFQQKKIEPKPYQPSAITPPKPAFELKKTQPKQLPTASSLPPPPADLPPPPAADLPPPPADEPKPAFVLKKTNTTSFPSSVPKTQPKATVSPASEPATGQPGSSSLPQPGVLKPSQLKQTQPTPSSQTGSLQSRAAAFEKNSQPAQTGLKPSQIAKQQSAQPKPASNMFGVQLKSTKKF
ncbi:hypothetical protein BLNAU_1285 [Blattamonas nauphoetae]|uniref:SCP domain-containing protein n=1 Tax=Blattamonas nauphoetae TaxID=2049346 RepID=A0ABQ9YIY7_9EUKA|nr:hypothetical protein BLNAU_1285 [Blattamonas nauphoetae]